MTGPEKARDYAARLRRLLQQARKDGFVFTLSGGRRTDYRLAVTVLPHTMDLSAGDVPAVPDDAPQPQLTLNQEGN
jgi:hypothetical protein